MFTENISEQLLVNITVPQFSLHSFTRFPIPANYIQDPVVITRGHFNKKQLSLSFIPQMESYTTYSTCMYSAVKCRFGDNIYS